MKVKPAWSLSWAFTFNYTEAFALGGKRTRFPCNKGGSVQFIQPAEQRYLSICRRIAELLFRVLRWYLWSKMYPIG